MSKPRKRILMVEDDPDIRRLNTEDLRNVGYLNPSVVIKRHDAWSEHPIADVLLHNYIRNMKCQNISQDQKQNTANTQQSTTVAALNQIKTDFKPSSDAVAKKAYFSYLNGGSQPGQEMKHWLEAEAQLTAGIDREMQIHPR